MQHNPDLLYQSALERQSQIIQNADGEHLANYVWPPAWRDPAMWAAFAGPIMGVGLLLLLRADHS